MRRIHTRGRERLLFFSKEWFNKYPRPKLLPKKKPLKKKPFKILYKEEQIILAIRLESSCHLITIKKHLPFLRKIILSIEFIKNSRKIIKKGVNNLIMTERCLNQSHFFTEIVFKLYLLFLMNVFMLIFYFWHLN